MAGGARAAGVSVTARALSVLAAFEEGPPAQNLTHLSRRAGLPPATCHRYVQELLAWGALTKGEDGRFGIGRRLWALGLLAPVHRDLKDVATPFMNDLYLATRCIVHLTVRDDLHALHVERIFGPEPPARPTQVGSRVPLHMTATGKVLLAFAPEEVLERALEHLQPNTEHTVTDPAQLRRMLEDVRSSGYAWTAEEFRSGRHSVAVPVFGGRRTVTASLGIVAPSPIRDRARFVPALQVAAGGMARRSTVSAND